MPLKEQVTISVRQEDRLAKLPPLQLIRELKQTGERFTRGEYINPRSIKIEDIVDDTRADLLGDIVLSDIKRGFPIPPFNLAATLDDHGKLVRESWDGSHRIKGIIRRYKENGFTKPPPSWCLVDYGLSRYEILMKKISAGTSVRGIKFVRLVGWVNEAFSYTPWASKYNITAEQAFFMTLAKSSGRDLVGGNLSEASAVKKWCQDIAVLSGSNVGTIAQYLYLAKISDPNVLKRVRIGGAFQKGQMSITLNQMKLVAEAFPYQQYPGFQNAIAKFANSRSLSSQEILRAVRFLQDKQPKTPMKALLLLSEEDWENYYQEKFRGTATTDLRPANVDRILDKLAGVIKNLNLPDDIRLVAFSLANAVKGLVIEERIDFSKRGEQTFIDSFVRAWVYNGENVKRILSGDKEAQDQLTKETQDMKGKQIYQLSLMLCPFIFDRETNIRDMVTSIFHHLLLEKLNSRQGQAFLTVLSGELLKFLTSNSGTVETEEILDTFMETLEEISRIRTSAPAEWKNLLSMAKLTAKTADDRARESVSQFIVRHSQLPNPNTPSSVTIFEMK